MRSSSYSFVFLGAFLMLAACNGEEGGEAVESVEDPLSADSPDGLDGDAAASDSAEDVLAAIAAMDMSYAERIDYLEQRAIEEGAVLTYGSPNLDMQEPWSEGFQEAYPDINHLYVRQTSAELFERILAEARAGRHLVDVINDNAVLGAALRSEELVAMHHGVPVPEDYSDIYVDDYGVTGYIIPHVITWNTQAFDAESAPRDWDDFLEPEYSGCIIDVGAHNFTAGLIIERGFEDAERWFEGFLDNDGVVRRGHTQSANLLAAGEFQCAVYLYADTVVDLEAEGAPIGWHAPEPTPAIANSSYVYRHTERPHAAALFVHWLTSQAGGQVTADRGSLAVHSEVTLLDELDALSPFLDTSSDEFSRLLPILSGPAGEVEEQVFDLLERYLVPNLVLD